MERKSSRIMAGFGVLVAYIPSKKWAVVMMGNTQEGSNGIESALRQRLADDIFEIPYDQRQDLESALTLQLQAEMIEYLNSSSCLFPNAQADPMSLNRPLSACTGTY